MTTKEIRICFWMEHPQFKSEYRVNKRQNDYSTDIRCAFVDYVNFLWEVGHISAYQASKITL